MYIIVQINLFNVHLMCIYYKHNCLFFCSSLSTNTKSINRGQILNEVARQSDLSITVIVKRAGYKARGSFYTHINSPDLPLEILAKYGKVLQYDFSKDIPQMKEYSNEESIEIINDEPKTLDEAKFLINIWRDKFYNLMEEYNQVLKKVKNLE